MPNIKVVIIGGGGHTKSIISLINDLNQFTIVGYTDLKEKNDIQEKYIGVDEDILKTNIKNIIIGVNYLDSPLDRELRKTIINKFEKLKFNFPIIIAKNSYIGENVKINQGTIVFNTATVNTSTTIGKHCILNTGCIIEHDCVLSENIFIGPGAIVCGHTKIGKNTFIGAGAILRDSINIVENVIVGAAANVVGDINESGLYLGNPAKKINK